MGRIADLCVTGTTLNLPTKETGCNTNVGKMDIARDTIFYFVIDYRTLFRSNRVKETGIGKSSFRK
jgi:hypothetical protein